MSADATDGGGSSRPASLADISDLFGRPDRLALEGTIPIISGSDVCGQRLVEMRFTKTLDTNRRVRYRSVASDASITETVCVDRVRALPRAIVDDFWARPRRSFFRSIDRPRTRPGAVRLFLAWWHYVRCQPFESVHRSRQFLGAGRIQSGVEHLRPSGRNFRGCDHAMVFGVVPAYNASMLLCPALSALTAFILCRRICGCFWPGGSRGRLRLRFLRLHAESHVGPSDPRDGVLPAAGGVPGPRRIDGDLSARRFTMLLALVLIGQIGSSLEILATMTIFGGVAILGAMVLERP